MCACALVELSHHVACMLFMTFVASMSTHLPRNVLLSPRFLRAGRVRTGRGWALTASLAHPPRAVVTDREAVPTHTHTHALLLATRAIACVCPCFAHTHTRACTRVCLCACVRTVLSPLPVSVLPYYPFPACNTWRLCVHTSADSLSPWLAAWAANMRAHHKHTHGCLTQRLHAYTRTRKA